jgi:uncharacterized protein (TIGR00661 family)
MNTNGKRVLFAVQGEGRGHLTQAITLQNMLSDAGYELCGVLVGTSSARKLPDFFYDQIKAPIIKFSSPNFKTDLRNKSIRIVPSVLFNLKRMPLYFRNMKMVDQQIRTLKPDLVINFYDPLIGLYYLLYNPGVRMICIAHQYVFNHPDFRFPDKGFFLAKTALKIFTRLTAARADKKLALSLNPLPDIESENLFVIPPLLRPAVFLEQPVDGNYILVYLLNSGYMDDIIQWHKAHPETTLHCFTDKSDLEGEWRYDDNLSFHQIDDKKFLKLMTGCRAFATTAGFESISEAMYLGKPVFMVPVENHFEQFSNARDGARAGAGIFDSAFSLDKLIEYLPHHQTDPAIFRAWAGKNRDLMYDHLEIPANEYAITPHEEFVAEVHEESAR